MHPDRIDLQNDVSKAKVGKSFHPNAYSTCQQKSEAVGNDALSSHVDEKPHFSGQCQKSFIDSYVFQNHTLTHVVENMIKCEENLDHSDQKSSTNYSSIKSDSSGHTDEKPYICDQCHKTFIDSNAFEDHRLKHMVETKIKCEVSSDHSDQQKIS